MMSEYMLMAFEEFIGKTMAEHDLYFLLSKHLQENFDFYQKIYFFVKINKSLDGSRTSHIAWVKEFNSLDNLIDYHHDAEYQRACALIKYESGKYIILGHGFWLMNTYIIDRDKISSRREIITDWDIESIRTIPRDILENGFGAIEGLMAKSKSSKAV